MVQLEGMAMMLNEVRRKPEKPRMWKRNGEWLCCSSDIVHVAAGFTQQQAYVSWKQAKERYHGQQIKASPRT